TNFKEKKKRKIIEKILALPHTETKVWSWETQNYARACDAARENLKEQEKKEKRKAAP
ncbi:hypothetical protein IscW_ISCW011653, partial [Ixodes scapularis]